MTLRTKTFGLRPPPIIGNALNNYNICAYMNLNGINQNVILDRLLSNGISSPIEYALASFLYCRSADYQKGYETILKGIYDGSGKPSWLWGNYAMLARAFDSVFEALAVVRELGTNYDYIFNTHGQSAFFGGLVDAYGCASEYWLHDDVIFVYPQTSIYILNKGATAYFGQQTLYQALYQHNKYYKPEPVNHLWDKSWSWVHNGEFIIPMKAMEKIASKSQIETAQQLGRTNLKLGKYFNTKLSGKVLHDQYKHLTNQDNNKPK